MLVTASLLSPLILLSLLAAPASAAGPSPELPLETLAYRDGSVELEGKLARPAGTTGNVPLVILFHQWMGPGDYEARRARQFAALGYAAFVADIYGKGVRAKDPGEAGKLAGIYRADRPLLRTRARAALDFAKGLPGVDRARVAAIGYCFGGGTVLELARDGAELAAAISVHGNLDTPLPAKPGAIKAAILAEHGVDDPFVTQEHVNGFVAEMKAAKPDWQLIEYGGAVHAFSDPSAGSDPSKGAAYDAKADARSFALQVEFLKERFK